jgi:hypothetical protein
MVPREGFRSTNVREEEKLFRKRPRHHLTPNGVLLSFMVTKHITSKRISKPVESRDTELPFLVIGNLSLVAHGNPSA